MIAGELDFPIVYFYTSNTKQKLFINYSRRGYSSNGEPGDNLFKPEEPSYFAEGLKMLIDQNIQSIEQIKFALNLNERDIENYN
ncbi:MAG: hypothetical protein K9I99_15055 [Melioribacteraceae bacterium]|nr:hypothetical protein [Melioribacteraceae bacterium]